MSAKKVEQNEIARKRKRIVPTRAAGTPTFDVVEDLFAAGFAGRGPVSDEPINRQDITDSKELTDSGRLLDTQNSKELETQPTLLTTPSQGQKKSKTPVAPVSNYQKVTNTITREAIPQGLFKAGKSKQVYDVLYGLTRGSIAPSRIICISKSKLRALSGVGARTTMDACLNHLSFVGLIQQRINDGGFHEGNEYEVFTPEEIESLPTLLTTPRQGKQGYLAYPASHGYHALKQGMVGSLETRHGRQGSESIDTELIDTSKTSLKTNIKNDDEAFADFNAKLHEAALRLTGRKFDKRDTDKLSDLADLLILQLDAAAKKTSGVSSVAPFLVEICRRKFLNVAETAKASKVKLDTIGTPNSGSYEIKLLDGAGRESALEQLREFASDDFLHDFKKWYTEEDWEWLTNRLGIS